jgi:hypothetical protein
MAIRALWGGSGNFSGRAQSEHRPRQVRDLVLLFANTMTFGRQSIRADSVAKTLNISDIPYFSRLVSPAP